MAKQSSHLIAARLLHRFPLRNDVTEIAVHSASLKKWMDNNKESDMQVIIVTDDVAAWSFLKEFPIIDADDYLKGSPYQTKYLRVINLCRSYEYQTIGYYVSLLAVAQDQKVVPSIQTMQDVTTPLSQQFLQEIKKDIQANLQDLHNNELTIRIYFGECAQKHFASLAKIVYEKFPLPLLILSLIKQNGVWSVKNFSTLAAHDIPEEEKNFMQEISRIYLNKRRFYPGPDKKQHFFHLAILIDPNEPEKYASSDKKALKKFVEAGESLGIQVDFIGKNEIKRLPEYAGLFIRNSTDVFLYTYQFVRYAEQENLVVIDDSQSILKCGNKVYQAVSFQNHNIKTPQTIVVNKYQKNKVSFPFPCVIKLPDSGYCLDVVKANNEKELENALNKFFKFSDLVIVQAFLPTEFDWRIGIIDRKPLYAVRYYMAKGHWQIINWATKSKTDNYGESEAVALEDVPEGVIQVALRAANLMGNGLYGVDVKSRDNEYYVIEVNDNPSLDHEVEDNILGDVLYRKIMAVFLHRMQAKHGMQVMPLYELS